MLSLDLLNYLENHQTEMLNMLEQLVNIDSGSYVKAGIDQVGSIMAEAYDKMGFDVEICHHEDAGNGVVARRQGNGKNLLLICHLDTAFPEGFAKEHPFTIDGNHATGGGVLDMKACLVACLYAIRALDDLGISPQVGLTVLMSGDEERGSTAMLDVIKAEGRRADWCVVTEGARANGAIVAERKGNAQLDISAHGRAVHAGNEPEKGRNAVEELAMKICKLRQIAAPEKGSTVVIGTFNGGENRIVTAENASMEVDLRFRTMEEAERMSAEVHEILAQPEIDGITLTYDLRLNRPPLCMVPGSEILHQKVEEISNELNIPYLTAVAGGVSDGNFVSALGVPTIDGMGPVGGMMCCPEEYLEIDTLANHAARLSALIASLAHLS